MFSKLEIERIAKKYGFDVVQREELEEIEGSAWVFSHVATGARLLFLQNDDENKSFSISFKTPPKDSTGVFHILEHSVLCGSNRYPVKEPFVNLLKSSMQTFLNAMTFPDKTVYPVASTNEEDLLNLMNVYLDAVFNPRIYSAEEIFQQEGWHKETDENGNLRYSGVVYNEMQGALSDPDSVLFDAICERLYPASAYSFESGGDPKHIPELTYEQFLETHARHYSPKNSYIMLYGNMEIEKFLKTISEDYLLPVQAAIDSGKRQGANPFSIDVRLPVNTHVSEIEMDVSPDCAPQAIAFRLSEATDVETVQAFSILMDALMASNVSPLKARLLSTGVAEDYYATIIEPIETPSLMIACQGVKNPEALQVLEETVLQLLRDWINGGIDKALIEASIDHAELLMREHNFGTADGVIYAMDCLSTWLYDDARPLDALKFETYFKQLRAMLEGDGFESLITKYILETDGVARARIIPSNGENSSQAKPVSPDERVKIDGELAHLHDLQNKPDLPENVAKLPYLQRSDVNEKIKKHKFCASIEDGFSLIRHENLRTTGVDYFNAYLDCSSVDESDYPYLSLLTTLLGKFNTADFSAEDIVLNSRKLLGRFIITNSFPVGKDSFNFNFVKVGVSCLPQNTSAAAELIGSILDSSNFEDEEKLLQILMSLKIELQQAIVNAGHQFARRHADSTLTWRNHAIEQISGISYYQFICDLCENLEDNLSQVSQKCQELLKKITSGQVILSTSADDFSLQKFKSDINLKSKKPFEEGQKLPVKVANFSPALTQDAFAVKSDVTFSAVSSNFNLLQNMSDFNGSWAIASKALSYDYLWNTIRVQGGAYGCGFSASKTGSAGFYTYRDPNVASSLETISKSGFWLKKFVASEREMDGYVVSAVADFDKPCKASALMARAESQFFSGDTEEDRERLRDEALHTTLDDVRSLASTVENILEHSSVCVVGNKDAISKSKKFDEITEL